MHNYLLQGNVQHVIRTEIKLYVIITGILHVLIGKL